MVGAVVGFAGAGIGAAQILASALGDHDGGSSMSGFFVFGPIVGFAGALLGAGLVMRFGGGYLRAGKIVLISAGILLILGGVLPGVASSPDRGPVYANVIEFELEFPAATFAGVEVPSANAMWGAAGAIQTASRSLNSLIRSVTAMCAWWMARSRPWGPCVTFR